MTATPLLGIDLGGTKIEMAVLDASGQFLLRERVPTPQGDYAATLNAVATLVQTAETRLNVMNLPVGIGTPGSLSPRTGLLRGANSTVLNGRPLLRDLQTLLSRPVCMQNDANCLAMSEAEDGAGVGQPLVFAVVLGTGVGGGIAMNGCVLPGRNASAGEWGHNSLPWPTLDELSTAPCCWCDQTGCIETWVSGIGFANDHARVNGQPVVTAEAIIAAMRAGDAAARASFGRYSDRLSRALAHTVNILDPDVIVLGGGMSNVPELVDGLPQLVARHVFSDLFTTPIRAALHGDSSGVRGAAWLTRNHTPT